jgi:DNA-binding XRE family transcriptional regulator
MSQQANPGGAADADPRTGLRAVRALRRLADRLEAIQVRNARRQGWSWQEIAQSLGVTRQAVHQKHAGQLPAESEGDG